MADALQHVPRKGRLLDLGCGAGQDTRALQDAGYRVVGLDLSLPLLLYARDRSPRAGLIQADIRNLPHAAGSFDGIWAAASLIHLPKFSLRVSLQCLAGLVTPGGILAATFIHGRGSGIVHSDWIPDRFISRWRKQELAAVLGRNGWQIISLKTVSGQEREGRWLNLIARQSEEITHKK